MLSDILWSIILLTFAIIGLKHPFIALSNVIFVDLLQPQILSFSFLANKPLSMLVTLAFFMSLALNPKKVNFKIGKFQPILLISLMIWITITTNKALFPAAAWFKYDYSFKTILFSLFIPFVLTSRRHLDFFVAVMGAAIFYFTVLGGMKTVFGTTGYGMALINTRAGDSGIVETSTLSMVAVFVIPITFYLLNHSIFKLNIPMFKQLSWGLYLSSVMTVIGTHARTGLVGLFTYFSLLIYKTKYKFKALIGVIVILASIALFAPQNWLDRMNTIQTANKEASALGRIVVWRWTVDFAKDNPIFGGGFDSYKANAGVLYLYTDEDIDMDLRTHSGKAYHNIYFEVLGEHGFVGLFIYLLIIWFTLSKSLAISRRKDVEPWQREMATLNLRVLIIFCVCGNFIGIAFSPWLYYFSGIAASLHFQVNQRPPETKL